MTASNESYSTKTKTSSAGTYERVLSRLDEIDKSLSSIIFQLSLPRMVEAIYSIPANFFGLIPSLGICPLWLAVLALEDGVSSWGQTELQKQHPKIILLKSVTVSLTIVFLVAWGLFQRGHMAALTKFLSKRHFYLVAIVFNVALLSYTLLHLPPDDPYAVSSRKAFSLSIYLLFLWPLTMLIIKIIKHSFRRVRPVAVDTSRSNDRNLWLDRKAFPSMSDILAKYQPTESFPSGDAASAAIFAITLTNIAPRYNMVAWTILFLACTGRMYILAHYLFDVVVGSMIAYLLHQVSSLVGLGINQMEW
eukprot:CAMPEP_0172405674 /NCGR_PEP_ID=MMETSP1061-20121228/67788_1 /TAXON_ID=37318 /ORGANISM="Pseudo-nitzschia pungens, Strain cf. pungens" /LENGTH=305 /DNA_ID=CAMNT_0013140961 /DNA_START=42 /DNA_END=956 /DNA_ORIENTATION=+